jgi:hypothetical protein
MKRRLSLALMSAALVCGQSVMFAAPALAVNCDLNVCMNICNKTGSGTVTAGRGCASWCLQTMEERKAKGQCKK